MLCGNIDLMGSSVRRVLEDGTFIEYSVTPIRSDRHRPHGVRYRLAWVQDDVCRVLFDNHHGKHDHFHVDGVEKEYSFRSVGALFDDFLTQVRKLGGVV